MEKYVERNVFTILKRQKIEICSYTNKNNILETEKDCWTTSKRGSESFFKFLKTNDKIKQLVASQTPFSIKAKTMRQNDST